MELLRLPPSEEDLMDPSVGTGELQLSLKVIVAEDVVELSEVTCLLS